LSTELLNEPIKVRGLKTIRAAGAVGDFVSECLAKRRNFDFTCVVVQLIRHPLSTIRSEHQSRKIEQIEQKNKRLNATFKEPELDRFCKPLLRDVQAIQNVKLHHLPRHVQRPAAQHPGYFDNVRAMNLRYDELVQRPAETARRVHAMMQVETDSTKLTAFIRDHFGTGHLADNQTMLLAQSKRKLASHLSKEERLQVLQEWHTFRKIRRCTVRDSMEEFPHCHALTQALEPLYVC